MYIGYAGFVPRESGELRAEAEKFLYGAHSRGRRDTLLFGREWVFRCSGQGRPLDSDLDKARGSYHLAGWHLPPVHS